MPTQETKGKAQPGLSRIVTRAGLLVALALILGLSYNAGNPNGIPLTKSHASTEDHEGATESTPPVIKNETESVTLIRSRDNGQ